LIQTDKNEKDINLNNTMRKTAPFVSSLSLSLSSSSSSSEDSSEDTRSSLAAASSSPSESY